MKLNNNPNKFKAHGKTKKKISFTVKNGKTSSILLQIMVGFKNLSYKRPKVMDIYLQVFRQQLTRKFTVKYCGQQAMSIGLNILFYWPTLFFGLFIMDWLNDVQAYQE